VTVKHQPHPECLAHKEEHASVVVITGLVPAIPMLTSTALHAIEITGTRPVMTGGGLPVLDEPASEEQTASAPQDEVFT
jgi:hypothetical protein